MERTIARRLIHTLHLVETSIPRFRDRPPGSSRLMGTSHLVQEMVTWRHRSISRFVNRKRLFQQYPPEAAVHPGSLFLRSDNKRQKATRALHRMAFAKLSP